MFGDYDYDDDVNNTDVQAFFGCFNGAGIEYNPMECKAFDSDDDEDVDFADFAAVRGEFSGALVQ